jgi:hypothetical protein
MLTLNAQVGKRIDETLAPLTAGGSERICMPALCYRMTNMRLVDSDQTES